ncbi:MULTISPECIES: extracellular solute-binding protein [Subtercola]|uniref:extracellular solute-binding protein n=1 Tax=Subtercola TaxID=120212 RepID=UPI0019200362|nr:MULTISPECIES: extracellular solute-binding protein [Subtercola]MEA9986712.1 extracellular solute-binding protein [Subtercola sp. RTI3]
MKLTAKKRATLGVALLTAAALALTACGTSGPGGGSTGNASAWALTGQQKTIQASFDTWNAANTGKKVDVQFFGNDAYKQKIRTAIGSGSSPTLIWTWGGGVLKSYVDANKLVPLDSSLTAKVFPAIAANGEVDGKLYAVPNNTVQPALIYFNKDVMAKAGLTGAPTTWDELLSDVKTLRAQGIAPFSLGGASKWPELMWLEYLTDRIGGPTPFKAIQDGEAGAWSNPSVIQALTMIQQLVDAGGFVDGFQSVATDSSADFALMYTGKAAMILQGAWGYAAIQTAAPDFISANTLGWGDFPTVTGGTGDASNVVGNASNYWSISADASKDQQTTAAGYLTGGNMTDTYIAGLLSSGGVPPITGLDAQIAKSANASFLTDVYQMSENAANFTLSWDQAIDPSAADALLTNLDLVFLKQSTPQQFADAMTAASK